MGDPVRPLLDAPPLDIRERPEQELQLQWAQAWREERRAQLALAVVQRLIPVAAALLLLGYLGAVLFGFASWNDGTHQAVALLLSFATGAVAGSAASRRAAVLPPKAD